MSRNIAGRSLQMTLSKKAVDLLDQLIALGVYGRSRPEVARRFVEERLQAFAGAPLRCTTRRPENRRRP